MFNSIFKILFFIEFMIVVFVRKIYTSKYRKIELKIDKKNIPDIILLALTGIGMTIPLVYVFSTVLDFADYPLPFPAGWIGTILFAYAIFLLWRSHADLNKNWTPTLGIRKIHSLVKSGVYKYIRHPMYAAHILWAIAQILILPNWIAGYSFIIFMIPQYLLRTGKEEKMMIEQFGDEYKDYIHQTGRILPRTFKRSMKK
jgi:protein-S-isoprenylcysteine O-methyltransferase Ste14